MSITQKTTILQILLLILGVLLGYSIARGTFAYSKPPIVVPQKSGSILPSDQRGDIFQTEKIQKAIRLIEDQSYGFDKKTKTEIEDNVLRSIVNWLGDKHSTYFTQKEAQDFQEALSGDFEGIGAVIAEDPHGIKITKIIPKSPAEKSWLKMGDVMTRAGDKNLVWETTQNAVTAIRWPKGSTVLITYIRGDETTESQITVTRDVVNVPSVLEKMLDNSIGYIEVGTFGEHTSKEFVQSWNNLSASWAKAMIIDFRYNGGGFLETAVDLASIILPKDTSIVTIKENDPTKNETLYTREGAKSNISIPIIILVNGYSASASEIVAGAVQDHGRGIILGEKTYGKWSVQEPFSLGDGSLVKLTTARWFTPKDQSIDEKWITPDIQVILTTKDYTDTFDRQLLAAKKILTSLINTPKNIGETIAEFKKEDFSKLTP